MVGLSFMLAAPFVALQKAGAQPFGPNNPGGPVATPPPTTIRGVNDVYELINDVFGILFWLLIVLAGIFIIWAAFNYLTAGGDPEKVQTANKKVIYAAVAVVVAVLARAIPTVVCSFLAQGGCEVDPTTGIP